MQHNIPLPRFKLKVRFSVANKLSRIPEPPSLDLPESIVSCTAPSSLGDFDNESEANLEKYATTALNKLNSFSEESFQLVECGPIASGLSSAGRYLHFNFKVKNNATLGASVETFFSEFIKTNQDGVRLLDITSLGPSSSLPDKSDTFGCVYCSSHNIHHPDDTILIRFHNGREDRWNAVDSLIVKLSDFLWRSEIEGVIPTLSHPAFNYFGRKFKNSPSLFASMALSLFNSNNKGTNYELVKPGFYGQYPRKLGWVVHINFEAKNEDDPDAPVETFFAEIIRSFKYVFVVGCKCLDPSDSVLAEEANLHGCECYDMARVHHPLGLGFVNGQEYLLECNDKA